MGALRQLEPRDAGSALVLTLGSAGLETEVSCFATSTREPVMTLDAKVQGTGWHTVTLLLGEVSTVQDSTGRGQMAALFGINPSVFDFVPLHLFPWLILI